MRLSLLVIAFLLFRVVGYSQKDYYSKRWSSVYKYELEQLPKSALAVVDSICRYAKKEGDLTQVTRALIYQSKFAVILEPDAELKIVQKFKSEIRVSKAPMRNILEGLLANIYFQYLQQNRHKFYGRTRTSEKIDSVDFRTWDLATLYNEIHLHHQRALKDGVILKQSKLGLVDELLIRADNSRRFRPTVFDLLAHHAIEFYRGNDSMVPTPVTSLTIDDKNYVYDFENIELPQTDTASFLYHALSIYQRLLAFHKRDRDQAAYLDVELERLEFIIDKARFKDKAEHHKRALLDLQKRYRQLPISTSVDFALATVLNTEVNNSETMSFTAVVDVCREAIRLFPMTDGALQCKILLDNILDPGIQLEAESYVPAGKPSRYLVKYQNIDSLRVRIYKITRRQEHILRGLVKNEARISLIDSLPVVHDRIIALKAAGDYREHSTEVVAPGLTYGSYLVRAGIADATNEQLRFLAYTTVDVTDLVLISTNAGSDQRFQVVNRNTGAPISGADIHLKNRPDNDQRDLIDQHLVTDKNGFAVLAKNHNDWYNIDINVTSGSDHLYDFEYFIGENYRPDLDGDEEEDLEAKVLLFTDRSIYRPGQTVYYKGIVVQKKGKKTAIVPGEYVEVWMEDVNGDEYEKKRVKTNSFGSFHGEFRLPAAGLTGEFTIYVDEDLESDSKFYDDLDDFDAAEHIFSVEEYKRPTFEVTFDPVKGMYAINDTVKVEGNAKAFSGSLISKAKFNYHVTRRVVYPNYYGWWLRPTYSPPQEITEGEGVTDAKGKFEIRFPAIPDNDVSKEDWPVFHYDVSIDVIDITGETRSASTIAKVGYHMITTTLDLPETIDRKVKRHQVSFKTENLNGQFVPAKGTIEIFKLASSNVPVRTRPWESPDLPLLSEEEFKQLFPHDEYESSKQKAPRREKSVFKTSFDSNKMSSFLLNVDKSWTTGRYMIEVRAIDARGNEAVNLQSFKLTDPKQATVPNNELFIATTDKSEYEVGENVTFTFGSASPDLTVTIDIQKDGKVVKTYVEKLSNNIGTISIPVTNIRDDGFSIHYTAVNFNSFVQGTVSVQVVSPTPKLDIETQTFRDKIEPGVDERWSFVIKGKDSEQKEAELLASMYDASLDQFKPHAWEFDLNPHERYYGYSISNVQGNFGHGNFMVYDLLPRSFHIPTQQYDRLDWFGMSLNKNDYIRVRYLERLYVVHDTVSTIQMRNDRSRRPGYIYGVVSDKDGTPIPGVNVLVKGTTNGTATGEDGSYMLAAGKGDELVFSFIGYNTIEARVGGQNMINAALGEDVSKLEEVVVVGYGVQERKSLTGAVVAIKSENITVTEYEFYKPDSSRLLEGRAAGVMITGAPGGSTLLRIRGTSALGGKSLPLYVVDGVIVDATQIDQSDLNEITVLKSAEATALYGARAANGVIIVTTQSGQKKIEAELAKVKARTNLNETAFFFPELRTSANGAVSFNFRTPESLTRWKLQLFAHRRDLAFASKTLQSITQKDFMVTPAAPRFLRVGDQIIFPAKIANLSSKSQEGFISLQLTDAITGKSLDKAFKNQMKNQPFKVAPKSNQEVMWKLVIPEDVQAVQYRVVASTGKYSDGEQNILPVLQNRMLVTESLPMHIRSGQTKTFLLDKLKTNSSTTLKHHQVVLEVTSNPVWYAIQSLPYLMEFPHECAEQLFSRYYANTLASFLLNSNPKLKEVFDQWSSAGQLISALEKNPELKSIIIQETPWLRDVQSETEQKKRMAALFDLNLMKEQQTAVLSKLENMQLSNGGFPWFSGGNHASLHITQHVVSGYGHLKHLRAVPTDDSKMMRRAVIFLDSEIQTQYDNLIRNAELYAQEQPANQQAAGREQYLNKCVPEAFTVQYLYMRTFFPEVEQSDKLKEVISFYTRQAGTYWRRYGIYQKGMIALVHERAKQQEISRAIMASLKETSIVSDELGMYWKENVAGWGWYESPVEAQGLLIEAFSEIESTNESLSDSSLRKTLDGLRIWLLKNKQTTQWRTTKATTEAVYALLLQGTDWLSEKNVEVVVGEHKVVADKGSIEAGTGYFKKTWKGEDVKPEMGEVKLVKSDEGIAWAGLYWQYFEQLDKITQANSPLKLSKKVLVVRNTAAGEVLQPITNSNPVKVGDLLRVRIELKVDRDMEFLHMKDMRGSGLEPVNVLSEYKWQDNLGYYESTKDASTNFFFDLIPTGVYVFEYDLRATNRGDFSNGITTIESMYAPEFSAHSEGIRIVIE